MFNIRFAVSAVSKAFCCCINLFQSVDKIVCICCKATNTSDILILVTQEYLHPALLVRGYIKQLLLLKSVPFMLNVNPTFAFYTSLWLSFTQQIGSSANFKPPKTRTFSWQELSNVWCTCQRWDVLTTAEKIINATLSNIQLYHELYRSEALCYTFTSFSRSQKKYILRKSVALNTL